MFQKETGRYVVTSSGLFIPMKLGQLIQNLEESYTHRWTYGSSGIGNLSSLRKTRSRLNNKTESYSNLQTYGPSIGTMQGQKKQNIIVTFSVQLIYKRYSIALT
jgi:hypothetical protein